MAKGGIEISNARPENIKYDEKKKGGLMDVAHYANN